MPTSIPYKYVVVTIVWLIVVYCVVTLRATPGHISLELKADVSNLQQIDVFFLEDGEAKGLAHRRVANDLSRPETYYFRYPRHFEPDSIVVSLGVAPARWALSSAGLNSFTLGASIDSHYWRMDDITNQLTSSKETSIRGKNDHLLLETIGSNEQALRIKFDLDYSKARPTSDFLIFKSFLIVESLLLLMLVFSPHIWLLFSSRKIDAELFEARVKDIWRSNKLEMAIGSVLMLVGVIVVMYPYMEYPGLHIEDTMEFTDTLQDDRNLFSLDTYRYYRGYTVFISEWIAYGVGLFKLSWQPFMYMLSGALFASTAMLVMAYSGIFSSRLLLLLAPSVLLFVTFTEPVFYLTLTGTLFSSTVLLMAIAIRPLSTQFILPSYLIATALAFSGPYGPQLLPLCLALLVFFAKGRKILFLIFIMAMTILYILSGRSGLVQLENVLNNFILDAYFDALTNYVFLLELFPGSDIKVGLAIIVLTTMVLLIFRKDRMFVKYSMIFIAISLTSMLTFFISLKYEQYGGKLIPAHTVIAQLFWLLFLLLCLDKLLNSIKLPATRVLSSLVIVVFSVLLITGKRAAAENYVRSQDKKLPIFIQAVSYARSMKLAEDEYVQLWHRRHSRPELISYRRGAASGDIKLVPITNLAPRFHEFYRSIDLQRANNVMLYLDQKNKIIRYSDGTTKSLKPIDEIENKQ